MKRLLVFICAAISLLAPDLSAAPRIIPSERQLWFQQVVGKEDVRTFTILAEGGFFTNLRCELTDPSNSFKIITPDPNRTFQLDSVEIPVIIRFFPPSAGLLQTRVLFYEGTMLVDSIELVGYGLADTTNSVRDSISISEEDELDFGDIFIGDSGETQFVIRNVGSNAIKFTEFSFNKNQFRLLNPRDSAALAPGASYVPRILCKPGELGVITGQISWQIIGRQNRYTRGLRALSKAHPDSITFPKDGIDFGEIKLQDFADTSFSITNSGNGSIILEPVSVENSEFSILNAADSIPLAPGEKHTVNLRCAPVDTGKIQGVVKWKIRGNQRQFSLNLHAVGKALPRQFDSIALSSGRLGFGEIFLLDSLTRELVISNIGSKALSLQDFFIDNPRFSLPDIQEPVAIDSGKKLTLSIHCKANDTGEIRGTLSFRITGRSELYTAELHAKGVYHSPPNTTVGLPDVSARSGELVFIPLRFAGPAPDSLLQVARINGYSARISVNKTLLTPLQGRRDSILDGWRVVELTGAYTGNSNGFIDSIGFISGLGDAERTVLRLDEFRWLRDGNGAGTAETVNGSFTLTDIFRPGGKPRLLTDPVFEMELSANPLQSSTELRIIKAPADARLAIYDSRGHELLDLSQQVSSGARILITRSMLPALGSYYCCLSAGKNSLTKVLRVE